MYPPVNYHSVKNNMEEIKDSIKLIKKEIKASWAWFLEYHNESTMIASKKTNRKWFRAWKPYFDTKTIKILKSRQKTVEKKVLEIGKKYTPNFKEEDEDINLNKKILLLIEQKKSKKKIFRILKVDKRKLGHRISALSEKGFINITIIKKKINAPYQYPIKKYRLNLEPFFEYAKTKNIEFDETEKDLIKLLFYVDVFRTNLYEEYKTVSYIDAIPKYFLKHYYISLLEEKNKFNYSKETLNFLLSGGGELKGFLIPGSHEKVLKEMMDTLHDESDWNPLENLKKINRKVIDNINLKMLKLLSS